MPPPCCSNPPPPSAHASAPPGQRRRRRERAKAREGNREGGKEGGRRQREGKWGGGGCLRSQLFWLDFSFHVRAVRWHLPTARRTQSYRTYSKCVGPSQSQAISSSTNVGC
eukprot:1787740-Rhodomonas_salina.1